MGQDLNQNATHLTALIGTTQSGSQPPDNQGPAGLPSNGEEFYNSATKKYMINTSTTSWMQSPGLTTTSTTTS